MLRNIFRVMMTKNLLKLLVVTLNFLIMGAGFAFADPAYYPRGPQTDVEISKLTEGGWTRCYSEIYSSTLPSLEELRNQCKGTHILYSASSVADPSNVLLLAAGNREVVFAGTNLPERKVVELGGAQKSNGTYFYAQDQYSIGFTKESKVQLFQADICASFLDGAGANPNCHAVDNGENRLSWHGNAIDEGGWRIGTNTGLNASAAFIKEIWVNNAPPPQYLSQKISPAISLSKDFLTCSVGRYELGVDGASIASVRYKLYINNEFSASITYDFDHKIPREDEDFLLGNLSALASEESAIFDLSGLSSYSAYCSIDVFSTSSSFSSTTTTFFDDDYVAKIDSTAQAWEDQRATATAANFTKEAREARKRAAARSVNG